RQMCIRAGSPARHAAALRFPQRFARQFPFSSAVFRMPVYSIPIDKLIDEKCNSIELNMNRRK
ncbi:hypothetical protein, partial [Burkholderia cepacia]|uniref:hypothetical protein n=1 Tax=Burkholderia cepacia TaxID=292 RepID=UPI001ABB9351